ncbi:MAG TPA: two-component regulator propeller domain-containing protein [Holophagaceae bacterium]|nr:two-component regulator propeller domain-containing protein [Holophagaceae bacterium]
MLPLLRWLRPCPWILMGLMLLWGCPGFLAAQPLAFRHFVGRDGLPQSQVRVLKEDRHGFLWVGTYGGVARLGASGFKSFGLAEGLGIGLVRDMLEDREGAIWVAQTDAGLARIRGGRVKRFGAAEGLDESNCYSLELDADGSILVGHANGLHRFDGHALRAVELGAWNNLPILSMARSPEGLWLSTRGGKLALWDGRKLVEEQLPAAPAASDVLRLRRDGQGRMWALTRPGLFRREQGRWVVFAPQGFPAAPKLLDFEFDGQGDLLVALGEGGLWIQDPQGGHQWITAKDGLPQELIYTAYRDRQGILWVGTDGEGLYAQVLPGLRAFLGQPPLDLGAVLGLAELPGEGLFFGTTRGVFQWREDKGIVAHWGLKEGLPSNEVWSLSEDGGGGLWMGTARGVVRMKGGRIQPGRALGDARIYQVLRWKGGTFVGSENGLAELDAAGRLGRHFDLPKEAATNDAYALVEDGDGLLVGTPKGLFRFDGSTITRVHGGTPFAHSQVICLYRDAQSLWVGTIQGLYRLKDGAWSRISVEEGLPDAQIYFVGDGGQGRIAIGHGKGVTLMEPDGAFHHLNQNIGLTTDETNKGSVLMDHQGRLWFGMVYGACCLDTRIPLRLPDPPVPTVLETLWSKGLANLPSSLELAPRPEFVEFDFELGLPIANIPPVYEVRLDGLSHEWQRVSEGHRVRYGGLRDGQYQFRVRASLDGVHWKEGRAVDLTVRPTWFEHPLGRAAIILVAALLLGAFIQWRTVRLRRDARILEAKVEDRTRSLDERNQELEEAHDQVKELLAAKVAFTRMVVHDLRSPLTTLTLLLDQLSTEATDRGAAPPQSLGLMRQETSRLEDMLRRLLDQARIEAVDQSLHMAPCRPSRILEGMEAALSLKAQNAGLAFTWEAEPMEGEVVADALAVQQIILNLFSNAMKVTEPGGRVGLRSEGGADAWVLQVWDTGRGLDSGQVDRLFQPFAQSEAKDLEKGWGLGLSIVKALVDAHGATIQVESELGKGTRFRITFPWMGSVS